ncbi:hypothetical protein AAG570_005375 [Ranatra chinensis]|uniref:Uncharacterized protein n=1 Tax=Ranatra chinensis TaxID=642074 RepID=A0ABD0Y0C3_9HEMI
MNDSALPDSWRRYVVRPEVRDAVHAGNRPFGDRRVPPLSQRSNDAHTLSRLVDLVENYRVLFYYGQLDVITPYVVASRRIDALQWSGSEEFRESVKCLVRRGKVELEMYWRSQANLTEVMVTAAGHFVVKDQPRKMWELMRRFLNKEELPRK